jgi:hypothetical protein
MALAVGGLVASAGPASAAAKPDITAGPGSSVQCSITAKVKLAPGLKNDWVKADHQSDSSAAVRAIPDTRFAASGPVSTSVKGKGTCTGSVTNGTATAPVSSVKLMLIPDPGHPGSSDEATCTSLLTTTDSTARYDVALTWKSTGARVADTTITGASITPAGLGFATTGGTISGSFAGGTSTSQGNVDGTTINAFLQPAPTSSSPTPAFPQCQPSIKLKTKKGVQSASLKAPKGLKKITIVPGSTLDVSR